MIAELLQKQLPEIFEPERPSEDLRALEDRTCGNSLERLHEAAVERRLKKLGDCPRTGLTGNAVRPATFFPEA